LEPGPTKFPERSSTEGSSVFSLSSKMCLPCYGWNLSSKKEWWFLCTSPATQKMEIGRITVLSQFGQKVSEKLSQQMSWVWWCSPATQKVWVGGSHSEAGTRQKHKTLS
jgi:hypothetical protein